MKREFNTGYLNEKPTLVIVTDLGLFKAYRLERTPQGTPRMELVEEEVFVDGHRRLKDTVTDMAGRHSAPTQRSWGAAISDDHNMRLENERRLIKQVARNIERIVQANGANGYWLAAPKDVNPQIVEEMPRSIRNCIEKNVHRDLTKADPQQILEHFHAP